MTHGDGGKGDTQRPTDHEKFERNFELIFGRKSGITKEEFDNVDKNFAEAHAQYKKDMECLKENQSVSQSPTEK